MTGRAEGEIRWDIQAAIGLHQLAALGRHHARRAAISHRYDWAFADLPIGTFDPVPLGSVHARHRTPKALFKTRLNPAGNVDQYAVTADGQRFIVMEPMADAPLESLTIVTNWTTLLKK